MFDVSHPRHPLLMSWKPMGITQESATPPRPVTTHAVFQAQLHDDSELIMMLDDLAFAYGYLTD